MQWKEIASDGTGEVNLKSNDPMMISVLRLTSLVSWSLLVSSPALAAEVDLCPAKGMTKLPGKQVQAAVAQLQAQAREREARQEEWDRRQRALYGPDTALPVDPDEKPEVILRLCNLDLRGQALSGIDLNHFDIRNVNFQNAKLDGANFHAADSTKGPRSGVNFGGASLRSANLSRAWFSHASFANADLSDANLHAAGIWDSDFVGTNISRAILRQSTFHRSIFQPVGVPNETQLDGIGGLDKVTFGQDGQAPLVQLRELLRRNGLRNEERSATYGIERNITRHQLAFNHLPDDAGLTAFFEGVFRLAVFEWTTGYGLYPGRALQLILLLSIVMIPIYAASISRVRASGKLAGIYTVLPSDRLALRNRKPSVENPVVVTRLHKTGLTAWKWATYFSLLSVFHIGIRDISVGTWISRIQPTKFNLEPVGWVRTASGMQSLLSLFLLVMWVFTYFGTPFQ